MGRMIAALMLMPPLSVGATAWQRFEILGGTVELPAPVQEAPEGDEKCEPRSPWLTPMLATHAGLQIADAHSTRRAIEAGARELNPFFRWAVTSDARAYTTKAGTAALIWWGIDRDACEHPRRALWFAIAANALYGFVVTHNYRVGTSLLAGQ